MYYSIVSDDTTREEGKKIGLIYKQSYRKVNDRGVHV